MKIIKLFCSLIFIICLTACEITENEEMGVGDEVSKSSSYKEGEIVLTTESLKEILVVQVPHLGEPIPDGLILIVMDKNWSEGYFDDQNKVWRRMNVVLNTKGADICRFENSNIRDNLTGASIVEVDGDGVQRVLDQRIYSDDKLLLNNEIHYVKFTDGVVTELTLSKGGNIFVAKGSSFKEKSISSELDILEYVDLVSAALRGGLNCSVAPIDL